MEMKKEHPSIAIGTVYKHLNALAEEGLLHRITESGSPDRYDCTERHDHLICSRCGRITDICLRDLTEPIEKKLGQKIISYDLRIRYICPACREQEIIFCPSFFSIGSVRSLKQISVILPKKSLGRR